VRSPICWGFSRAACLALLPLALMGMMSGCEGDRPTEAYGEFPSGGASMQDAWPHWSPADTNLIAYTHFPSTWEEYLEFGDRTVRILDLGTLESRHITYGQVFGWSPDGSSLIVCCGDSGYVILDLESGCKEPLPIRGADPDISPCGKLIAFWSDDPMGASIYNLETGQTRWVCSGYEPDWSPDGLRLLCSYLQVYDTSGVYLDSIPYDDQYGYAWHARWSPDGTKAIYGSYCSSKKKRAGIWVIDVDGANQLLLACPGAVPSVSPDGQKVAYGAISSDGRAMVLWTVKADGTGPTQVTFPDSGLYVGVQAENTPSCFQALSSSTSHGLNTDSTSRTRP